MRKKIKIDNTEHLLFEYTIYCSYMMMEWKVILLAHDRISPESVL